MTSAVDTGPRKTRVAAKAKQRPGDQVVSTLTVVAGGIILAVLAAVAVFLLLQSLPAFTAPATDFKGDFSNFWSYVVPLGTNGRS